MYSARFLVCAVGALFVAHRPDYPGIDEFAGECYHTGRWPHHPVSFEGKRVGIMGTGSSGIQAIPEIAKTAEHVTVFQRTPQYALPARNRPMTDAERSAYQADWQDHRMSMRRRGGWPFATSKLRANEATAAERQARYEEMWALGGMNLMINSYVGAIVDADLNNEISDFVRGKIRQTVKDAATAEKLMPDYHIGTKRIILDNGYFETYNRDNVSLVDLRTDPIESFAAGCVSTQSQEIPLDMLVLATGYDAVSGSMLNLNPRGRSGIPLQQKWAERFDTHLGVSVAGFPNMFMIHGPGSPGVFFTMPLGAELQVQWVGQCIRHLDGNGHGTVETTPAAEQAWDAQIQAIANKTLYPKTNSWYLGANIPGKPRQFLGHLAGSQYFDQLTATAEADFAGFVFEPAADS
jgi:cation diffusion facilitator CzcD-associated flavoprotein CzcO